MNASVDGKRVASTAPAMRNGRRVTVVRYTDGTSEVLSRTPVSADLPAGRVRSGWMAGAPRVHRASTGKWQGERDGTNRELFMATASVFNR